MAKDRCLDLTGKIFGLLKVIYKLDKEDVSRPYWMCECECGSLKVHTSSSLNNTLSCGCLGRKLTTERSTKHGMAHTRLYKIYKGMKKRCYSENAQNYKHYGGRGIILSSDWLGDEGFTNFKDWSLENGYTDELTIERIDVNGNYEPNNCCWIPKKEQFRNKTNTIRINIYNSQYSLDDLHKATNIPYQTLYTKTKHQSYSETKLIEYLETRTKMKIQEILKGIKNEL
ncbi:hypothetical protein A9X05_09150 [Mycobacterium sp. E3298]|nr:hypothetical protein A9X05_09150 [Mycobacterium sp. E3298]